MRNHSKKLKRDFARSSSSKKGQVLICTWVFLAFLGSQRTGVALAGPLDQSSSVWAKSADFGSSAENSQGRISQVVRQSAFGIICPTDWRKCIEITLSSEFCHPLQRATLKIDRSVFLRTGEGLSQWPVEHGHVELLNWRDELKFTASLDKPDSARLADRLRLPAVKDAEGASTGPVHPIPPRQVVVTTSADTLKDSSEPIGPLQDPLQVHGPQLPPDFAASQSIDAPSKAADFGPTPPPSADRSGKGLTSSESFKSPNTSDEGQPREGQTPDGGAILDVPLPGVDADDQKGLKVLDTWGTFRMLNVLPDINPGQAFILRDWYRTNRDQAVLARELRLPPGWSSRSSDRESLKLSSGAATLDIVNITPPANAPAGDYTLQLVHHFEGQSSPPISIPITIKPYYKLRVNADSLPPALSQGEPVALDIYLKNYGNTPLNLTPSCTSNLLGRFEFSPKVVSLQPGEGGIVRVNASNFAATGLQNSWVMNFKFTSDDRQELGKCSASSSVFADALNRARVYENTIDTQLQWLYASDGKLTDLVWQWSGSGYINSKRSRKVDFFLQVPGEHANGSQDPTYKGRLSLYDVEWRVDLGDSTYTLSPLTQPGVLARGLRLYRHWHNYQAALFALKERDYTLNTPKRGKQTGGSLICTTDAADVSLEVLDKRRQDTIDTTALSPNQRVYSLQLRTVPRAWGRLLATIARNGPCELYPQESESWACQIGWQTPFKSRWQGSAVMTQQQPGYWGSVQDRREASLALSREYRGIYLSLQGFYGRDNLRAIPTKSGLQSEFLGLNLRRALPWRLRGSLGLNYRRKFDKTQKSEDDSSHGICPGLAYSGDILSVDSTLQIFRARDYLKNYTRWPQLQPQLNVECQVLSNLRLFWNASWGTSPIQVPFASSTGHRLGLFWNTSDKLQLNFATNFSNSQNQRNQNYSTDLTWRPWSSHLVKLTYNSNLYPRTSTPKGHALTLNYSIFFGLPSGRSTGCDLRGQISDEQDPKSSHRYIVCLGGRKSLTSESGQYIFSNVPAGSYPLWIENLPPGKVENDSGIQTVDLITGKLAKRDLKVASGARIGGYIRLYRDDKRVIPSEQGHLVIAQGEASSVEGIPGAVVTLREETGTRRLVALTNAQGHFEFGQVHPGRWVVAALEVQIPENYKLESASEQVVEVTPGGDYDLDWRVVGVQRKIKMLNSRQRPGS